MKAKVYCKWGLKVDLDCDRQVNIYVDQEKKDRKVLGEYDVLYLCEPHSILPRMLDYAMSNANMFDLIVASSDRIEGQPKVVHLEFGTTWIPANFVAEKVTGTSLVVGAKRMTEGHNLRHTVWNRQSEIRTVKKFWVSRQGGPVAMGWPMLGDSKTVMFDAKFHIAIENTRSRYYFTEKLMDCFMTETVPIYWGCLNIGDYFDVRGMLVAGSANAIISAANSAADELYEQMLPYIKYNKQKAEEYRNIGARLAKKIKQTM
jgi:hypothetical protein